VLANQANLRPDALQALGQHHASAGALEQPPATLFFKFGDLAADVQLARSIASATR
jgi:hypothetical protein